MYEYLVGVGILFLVWAVLFSRRKDLRKPMIWSGMFYLTFTLAMFTLYVVLQLFFPLGAPAIPGYWNPETLFNLGSITQGLSIEDILFMFFVGGVAAAIYESALHEKMVRGRQQPHRLALLVPIIAFLILVFFIPVVDSLIVATLLGTLTLWFQRHDLIKHSLLGGGSFLFLYVLAFFLFTLIFPNFITASYVLEGANSLVLFGIPLLEYLYAFSFGLLWAPMYEYYYGMKDKHF